MRNDFYSRLSLNRHLYKMDTSIRRTPLYNGHLELVPAFLYSLYLALYKTDISLRRTILVPAPEVSDLARVDCKSI